MEQFAIGANFKSAAARRNERERFDAFAEFKNFGRQTDGLGRVVSNYTIFDRDFRLHPARSFPQKRYGVALNRSSVLKRSDAPRAVWVYFTQPLHTCGAPFDLTSNLEGEIDPAPDHSEIVSRPFDHAKTHIGQPADIVGDAGLQAGAKLSNGGRVTAVVNGMSDRIKGIRFL